MSRRRRRKPIGSAERSVWDSLYPTLDLHGRTAVEAERDAERWLLERQREGDGVVRLVTGRGLHSVGPPILPGTIEDLLSRLRGSVVESHDREPGGGAYKIQLKSPRGVVRTTRPLPAMDPALERQAADALAELGITPTPALVRAEARRIAEKRRGDGG